MQHLIEVLTEGPVRDGVVAHRRTASPRQKQFPGESAPDGTPTTRWPACMPKDGSAPERWHESSAGWALGHGAVPCTAAACGEVAR